MHSRRELLGIVTALAASTQAAPVNHAETVHRQPLPAPFDGWEAEFALVTMGPGPGFAPHKHNGFVLGYVLDGAFRFAIDDQAARVLHAGEVFYEPPGATHTISASADATRGAHVLAIVIAPKARENG